MEYHFSTTRTKDIKLQKEELIQAGYPISEVIKFVKKNLDIESYRQILQGKENVYLVMPSTSGRNIIPKYIAARLQKEFGGQIIVDYALPMHETKTAYLSAIGKLRETRRYEIREQSLKIPHLEEKNLIVVDDVVSTGTSLHALCRALKEKGIFINGVVSVAQSDKRLTSERDIERFTEKLQENRPPDPELRKEVALIFAGTLKHHLNTIEREITGDKKRKYREEVYEYIKREASRAGRETGLARSIQPGSQRETQLFPGSSQGSTGIPDVQGEAVSQRSGPDRLGLENLTHLQNLARSYGYHLPPSVMAKVSEAIESGQYSLQEIREGMVRKIEALKLANKNTDKNEIELSL